MVFAVFGMESGASRAARRLLAATHSTLSLYGWLAFLGANVAMTAFALGIGAYGLLLQQIGFTATMLLGLRRSAGGLRGAV